MVQGQKYHYLYKTTCLVTGSYYIGIHSTENLEDEYLGSGRRLRYSLQKHGRENHAKEILEFFDTRDALVSKEREIVNEDKLLDPLCMNLARGGEGGFVNREAAAAGARGMNTKTWKDPEFRKRNAERIRNTWCNEEMRERVSQVLFEKTGSRNGWKGRQQGEKWRKMISAHNSTSQKGEKNSQHGTCWIFNESRSIKIKREELPGYLLSGWRKGRKMRKSYNG